jgi:hypothetical protein
MSYLYRQCLMPGCTVMIGWAIGALQGNAICKWCHCSTAYYADGSLKKIDQEGGEFGSGEEIL